MIYSLALCLFFMITLSIQQNSTLSPVFKEKIENLFHKMNDTSISNTDKKSAFESYISETGNKEAYDNLVADIKKKADTLTPANAKTFVTTLLSYFDNGSFFDSEEKTAKLFEETKNSANLTKEDEASIESFEKEFHNRFTALITKIIPIEMMTPAP